MLNMFWALLCPSSGARDYAVGYHIDRFVLGSLYVGGRVQLGWSSVRAAARTLLRATVHPCNHFSVEITCVLHILGVYLWA